MTKLQNIISTIFKHIAKRRTAKDTFAKSLKCSLFSKTSIVSIFAFVFITSTYQQTHAQIQQTQIPTLIGFQPVNLNNNNPTKNDRTYPTTNPTPNNNKPNSVNRNNQIQEIENLYKENKTITTKRINFSFPSNVNKKGTKEYYQAYETLLNMLEHSEQLNIKKAVFTVENAYYENKYQFSTFDKIIKSFATFCKYKMKEENTNQKDNRALNEILFRLLSDTMTVTNPVTKKKVTHYPVQYDFNDFYGMKDWTNMFVTKLAITNFGQCHSMPLFYKILAKEIGAECYISTSPNHLYIKYKSGNQWKNVELTNGHYTSDAYVIGSGYIKSEAIKNKTYLDTLSDTKTIALLMQDLAKGYYIKYGMDDFVLKCCNKGLEYYPNDSYGMCIKSDYYTMLMQYIVSQTNFNDIKDVLKIPQAKAVFQNMNAIYSQIDDAGVTQMPEEAYEAWLSSLDQSKRKQQYDAYQIYMSKQPKLPKAKPLNSNENRKN